MKRILGLTFLVSACCVTGAFGWSETFSGTAPYGFDLGVYGYGGVWGPQAMDKPTPKPFTETTAGGYMRITTGSIATDSQAVFNANVMQPILSNVNGVIGGWVNMNATPNIDSTEAFVARVNPTTGTCYAFGFNRGWADFRIFKVTSSGFGILGNPEVDVIVAPTSVPDRWDKKYYMEFSYQGSDLKAKAYDENMVLLGSISLTDSDYTSGITGFAATLNGQVNPQHNPGPGGIYPTTIDSTFDSLFCTGMPGDANGDGVVNVSDLGILAAHYGSSNVPYSYGDFNFDGTVDVSDLGILAARYGTSGGSVPEPATLSLLAISGLALLRKKH